MGEVVKAFASELVKLRAVTSLPRGPVSVQFRLPSLVRLSK